ncbi:hypothetical protein K474DRAFT_1615593 [Panus rudis PR-1116 ss-1]|nr:hypothetical protein K474DRAFT_1615593 [Panus rudis PR-1116 ss-1]
MAHRGNRPPRTPKARSAPNVPPDAQAAIDSILSSYSARESNTGITSLVHHLSELASDDPEKVANLLDAIDRMKSTTPDLSSFDFKAVPVTRRSFWVLQLQPIGFQTRNGTFSDEYADGAQPVFQVVIYDERGSFRVADASPPGMPSSAFLLDSIKRAIASPLPPLQPALPELFLISIKLQPHADALRPFLDSLPKPFKWRVETPEEAQEVAEGVDAKNKVGVVKGLEKAEAEKSLGNQAIGRKDRKAAVTHYTKALEYLHHAAVQKPTEEQDMKIRKLLSVCLANRAAAWQLDGPGQDPKKALKDSQEALTFDNLYSKAYYRAARSYKLLSEPESAAKILIEGLRKPELASDKGLTEALVDILGGLPDDPRDMRKFVADAFQKYELRGLKEFDRVVNAHLQKTCGPDTTIDTILSS